MEKKTFKKRFSKTVRPKRSCRFCKTRMEIDYKNVRVLANFIGESARILPS
ncbi:ribosomal protein S18, partial [bacterium]|nr:ribosomal protein S18 [bacterium]